MGPGWLPLVAKATSISLTNSKCGFGFYTENGSSKELVTTYAKNYGLEVRVPMLGGTIRFDSKEKKRIASHS